jgi:hypothetical protein
LRNARFDLAASPLLTPHEVPVDRGRRRETNSSRYDAIVANGRDWVIEDGGGLFDGQCPRGLSTVFVHDSQQ